MQVAHSEKVSPKGLVKDTMSKEVVGKGLPSPTKSSGVESGSILQDVVYPDVDMLKARPNLSNEQSDCDVLMSEIVKLEQLLKNNVSAVGFTDSPDIGCFDDLNTKLDEIEGIVESTRARCSSCESIRLENDRLKELLAQSAVPHTSSSVTLASTRLRNITASLNRALETRK